MKGHNRLITPWSTNTTISAGVQVYIVVSTTHTYHTHRTYKPGHFEEADDPHNDLIQLTESLFTFR